MTRYQLSFSRHFDNPEPLPTLVEISTSVRAIEREPECPLEGFPIVESLA